MSHDAPVLEVYRAPMRSRDDSVVHAAAVAWALQWGVVGVGGVVGEAPDGPDDAVDRVRAEHGDRLADRLRRFIDVEISSFAWTRTEEVGFRLGRIHGPWAYDASPSAAEVALPHTRACRWIDTEVSPSDVPADVLATFERGGRNFQRVRSESAERATLELWERS